MALATLGLAIGGLTAATHTIGLQQTASNRALADSREDKIAGVLLNQVMEGAGPFASDDPNPLTGTATHFSVDCNEAKPCRADLISADRSTDLVVNRGGLDRRIRLPGATRARFVYVGSKTVGAVWPSSSVVPERLRAITIVRSARDQETPIAAVWLWNDELADCVFDALDGACRKVTP